MIAQPCLYHELKFLITRQEWHITELEHLLGRTGRKMLTEEHVKHYQEYPIVSIDIT